jgi:1,2-diacylglycerol 3-alpha-glucosyltransferase
MSVAKRNASTKIQRRHLWIPPATRRRPTPPDLRNPKGVLLLNEAFTPLIDGVINVVENLYASLSERGIYTHIVTTTMPGYEDTHTRISRLPSVPLIGNAPYRMPLPCNADNYLPDDLAEKIDIVHLHSGFSTARAVLKWARKHDKAVVFTNHTKFYDKISATLGKNLLSRTVYSRMIGLMNQCDVITCPGAIFGEQLLREGVDAKKFRVVRNGVAAWPETTQEQRERMMLTDPLAKQVFQAEDEGRSILLFVGQHIREKNPHLLMQSLAILKKRGEKFLCLFVGGGDLTESLIRQAKKLNIEKEVVFVGRVRDRVRLSMIFALSDLMTFPSTFETSGLVVMEAAQHGLPTVGIQGASGISEVIKDGDNGFLAPLEAEAYASRITSALSDPEALQRVRARAEQTIARTKDAMIDDFLAAYRSVLSAQQRRLAVG